MRRKLLWRISLKELSLRGQGPLSHTVRFTQGLKYVPFKNIRYKTADAASETFEHVEWRRNESTASLE